MEEKLEVRKGRKIRGKKVLEGKLKEKGIGGKKLKERKG